MPNNIKYVLETEKQKENWTEMQLYLANTLSLSKNE